MLTAQSDHELNNNSLSTVPAKQSQHRKTTGWLQSCFIVPKPNSQTQGLTLRASPPSSKPLATAKSSAVIPPWSRVGLPNMSGKEPKSRRRWDSGAKKKARARRGPRGPSGAQGQREQVQQWKGRKGDKGAGSRLPTLQVCVSHLVLYPPTPLPARGRRWGSVRLALERDGGSLLPSLSPSPVQPCTLPAFFLALFSCSSSFLFFPFPFCCQRTPLVGARCRQTSAAWKSAGSEAFVAGRSLWTDSLAAYWHTLKLCQTSAAWKSAGSEAFVAGRSLWTDSFAAYWTQVRR